MRKQILILAKSHKRTHDGRFGKCIAGIIRDGGRYKWVRLVADKDGDAVPEDEFKFNVLDVIEADLTPCPLKVQVENHMFSNARKVKTVTMKEVYQIYLKMEHSFFGSYKSTYDGVPDHSLTMLQINDIRIFWQEIDGRKNGR